MNDTELQNDEGMNKPKGSVSIVEITPSNPPDSSNDTTARPVDRKPRWVRIRLALRDPFSEFLGVFTLIMFGDGVVAQVVLSNGQKGDYQSINWGYLTLTLRSKPDFRRWGIGVMLGVYVAGISGAHLNPAVTFANCVFRKFSWKKFLPYTLAQTLGAFMAAAVIYANYRAAIDAYEGVGVRTVTGATSTAGIFCTYPAAHLSTTGQFFSESPISAAPEDRRICCFSNADDDYLCNHRSREYTGWESYSSHFVFPHLCYRWVSWLANRICGRSQGLQVNLL